MSETRSATASTVVDSLVESFEPLLSFDADDVEALFVITVPFGTDGSTSASMKTFTNSPGARSSTRIETLAGATERHDAPDLDGATLTRLARQIAALSHQGISREHPLLSATLPDGARVQIVAPPATRDHLVLAIRKHVSADLSLGDYVASGAFDDTRSSDGGTHELDLRSYSDLPWWNS